MTNKPDDLVPVAKVRTGVDAARVIAILAARGIEGASAGVDPASLGQFAAVHVLVRRIDLERAELALAQARGERAADFDFGAADQSQAEGEPPPSPVRRPGWRRNTTTTGVVVLAACAATVIWCGLTLKYVPSTLGIILGAGAAVGVMLVIAGAGKGQQLSGRPDEEDE